MWVLSDLSQVRGFGLQALAVHDLIFFKQLIIFYIYFLKIFFKIYIQINTFFSRLFI
jgi:hypothetical protein